MNVEPIARHILVNGVVQGVGFRPFVYGLATRHHLSGWVCNTSAGVELMIEGETQRVDQFLRTLTVDPPPLARIESVFVRETAPDHLATFEIRSSLRLPHSFQPISADVALCAECERELFDPQDRRYLYPFINCTNCGPRYSIIRDLPYDRPATTMAGFALCPTCEREYADPLNRRFHAQPIACPTCGPKVWLVDSRGRVICDSSLPSILETRRLLAAGGIVAIKGLGGFHLACDATHSVAVNRLRILKRRTGKPFAVMAADLACIETVCVVNEEERTLLTGVAKPIVVIRTRQPSLIAAEVAPAADTLGVMLPYTPLHHLLLNQTDPILQTAPAPRWLVMTSGNLSDAPIEIDNDQALSHLARLADALLLHDRDIEMRCDDSVVRVDSVGAPVFLRRSRGYAPHPIRLPFEVAPMLAVGGELKNVVGLAREKSAFLSQHIGDLENAETFDSFERTIQHFQKLYRIEPEVFAHDLHPNYFSTQYALSKKANGKRVAVQHHHAHIAACLADNGCEPDTQVIGVAFDGTGYGTDGAIWGGEFLIAGYRSFQRAAHLEYVPLPGGDTAIRKPWRAAIGYAAALGLELSDLDFYKALPAHDIAIVKRQVERGLNTPLTSSLGRLFDVVAVLAGLRSEVSYEAQAAIQLEACSNMSEAGGYPYRVTTETGCHVIRLGELLESVIEDVRNGMTVDRIGSRFHHTLAILTLDVCRRIRSESRLNTVALSGGVWQNILLLKLIRTVLQGDGFVVLTHRQVPPNDGGLALGQVAVAAHSM
jgi:hydrogenase maturation protein HypF